MPTMDSDELDKKERCKITTDRIHSKKYNEKQTDLNNVLAWLIAIIIEEYNIGEFIDVFNEKYTKLLTKPKSDLPVFWKINSRKIDQAVYRYRDYFHKNKSVNLNEGELLAFFLAISFQLRYYSSSAFSSSSSGG